jgi:Phage integrase family
MAGVDIRTVQELLGHETIAMTVRYSHLAPQHTLAAVEKLVPKTGESVVATAGASATTTATERVVSSVATEPVLQQVIQ